MSDAKYRLLFAALGLAFLGVVAIGFLFGSPESDQPPLPAVLEEISPIPSAQVPLQTPISVDVPVGYRIEFIVDNFRIPESEVRFVEGTGVFEFSPSQSSLIDWGPGPHTITVTWRRIGGLPDVGSYTWTFRVF